MAPVGDRDTWGYFSPLWDFARDIWKTYGFEKREDGSRKAVEEMVKSIKKQKGLQELAIELAAYEAVRYAHREGRRNVENNTGLVSLDDLDTVKVIDESGGGTPIPITKESQMANCYGWVKWNNWELEDGTPLPNASYQNLEKNVESWEEKAGTLFRKSRFLKSIMKEMNKPSNRGKIVAEVLSEKKVDKMWDRSQKS